MGRRIPLVYALIVAAALLVALVTTRANEPSSWELELDKYVEYRDSLSSGSTSVELTERASRPWNFAPDMSGTVFGDSVHFEAESRYNGERNRFWTYKRLPYPPTEVWCASLRREPSAAGDLSVESSHSVVFVAEHQDMYCADLLVHESSSDVSDPALSETLSRIGCASLLGEWGQAETAD